MLKPAEACLKLNRLAVLCVVPTALQKCPTTAQRRQASYKLAIHKLVLVWYNRLVPPDFTGNLSRKLNFSSAMKALIMSQPELASGARVEDAIKNKAQKKHLNMVHTLERKTHNPKKSDGENPGNQTK
ncbi:hypothetical protein DAPPUDRAFT_246832 [Daphnia pulex]|uniref:Uncharacterized protein n=1 Tax=Daphnia pulex TaxID=6669 RepID=E9GRA6_DAPPU|nr:hypothetical protein DAPPUDRAFT_246832 [Daphnia pulex]|eukprot:EFX77977.1 hypothetical protein DAPPUDRAFT_246832 [Daphnia pulex]